MTSIVPRYAVMKGLTGNECDLSESEVDVEGPWGMRLRGVDLLALRPEDGSM